MKLGIDPGQTGALALVTNEGELVWVRDMPVQAKTSGKGNEVNAYLLADAIEDAASDAHEAGTTLLVVIEQVNAMPGGGGTKGQPRRTMGATSAFGFGDSFGVIRGVCAALGLKVKRVRPQVWKKQAGLQGKLKDVARTKCIETWPGHRDEFKRKKDIGRADAAMIGLYGCVE